jgi:hypothetical protein
MRIALTIAIAFSIASGAGTYAYLDAKTDPVGDRALGGMARYEWVDRGVDRAHLAQRAEILLPPKAP